MKEKKKASLEHVSEHVLVTVKGPDRPGITASLTRVVSHASSVRLADIEQIVVHRKLILSFLLSFEKGAESKSEVLKELLFEAKRLGVALEFEVFDPSLLSDNGRNHQYVITCIGENVGALQLHGLADFLAQRGINIDKIGRLTSRGLNSVEMIAHTKKAIDPKKLSQELLALSGELHVDIAVQKHDLLRRAKRLVVFDMDSTLIQCEVVDELAREAGMIKKVATVTRRAMGGKIKFEESLRQRVAALKGVDQRALERVYRRIKLTKGTERLLIVLRRLGFKVGLISGGFSYFTERLKERLGLDYAFANELEIKNGRLTGRIVGDVVDEKRKAFILEIIAQSEGVSLDQTIAIGDGANDLRMLSKAGLGIAFHAHQHVKQRAGCALSMHETGLDAILYLLGISDVELAKIVD